jgi:hypothetical protein
MADFAKAMAMIIRAQPWQEGAGAAGLHGLTVCDAA